MLRQPCVFHPPVRSVPDAQTTGQPVSLPVGVVARLTVNLHHRGKLLANGDGDTPLIAGRKWLVLATTLRCCVAVW